MSFPFCQCRTPKPRNDGRGGRVCVECHGQIRPQKKREQRQISDTMPPDDLQALQDRINRLRSSVDAFCDELTAQVQRLKRQY